MLVKPATIVIPTPIGTLGGLAPAKIEPVLLIHGTFANQRTPGEDDWWLPNSKFCRQLDELLSKQGSAARCWAHLAVPPRSSVSQVHADPTAPFAWTGENSERSRRNGGRALADELAALEQDAQIERYHLIGHSHGGNVILNALRAMARTPAKLRAVVFMGTPVLSFAHREPFDARWIGVPLYIAVLIVGAWAYHHWPGNGLLLGLVGFAIVVALLMELVRSGARPMRAEGNLYGSGTPSAFAFDIDEAITSLSKAQMIIEQPQGFIEQFIKTEAVPTFAVAPTPAPEHGLWESIQETGPYAVLEAMSPPTLSINYSAGLAKIQGAPSSAPLRRPTVLRTLLDAMAQGPFPVAIIKATLFACAVVPSLVVATALRTSALVSRAADVIWRSLALKVARLAMRKALPRLVAQAALGADEGRFENVRDRPPGVTQRERISDALQQEAASIAEHLGQQAGKAIVDAIGRGDAFAIKTHVTDALRNTALAHSYYYRSSEIQERIALLIARK